MSIGKKALLRAPVEVFLYGISFTVVVSTGVRIIQKAKKKFLERCPMIKDKIESKIVKRHLEDVA